MVAPKARLNSLPNRVAQDPGTTNNPHNKVGVGTFKIYTEKDKVKKIQGRDSVNAECKKSDLLNNASAEVNEGVSKESLKNSEKGNGKLEASVKKTAGRRVLADISNVRGNSSRKELFDGSKPVFRPSLGLAARSASSSSSKPLLGKLRTNPWRASGAYYTLKKAPAKDLKANSDELRTKDQGRKSVSTFGRTCGMNTRPPTRKSMPVLKLVNQVGTGDVKKEDAESSDKNKGKHGFPTKPKVGRNVVPKVSNSQSKLWKNRVSDGFTMMASKGQPKVDARALSRKSVKPAVKTAVTVSNARGTSKSKCASGLNKSTLGAAISSKTKEDMEKSSLSEHRASVFPSEQPAQKEIPSDKNSNLGTTVSHVFIWRKSDRRKSFTSSLMARSKLLKELGEEVIKQEMLPNIYDDSNHLEVAEYVDDIYQYYWIMEAQNQSLKNYMEIQADVTPQMRGILINWLIEVHLKFDLMQETLFLMVSLLDQYLSLSSIKKSDMQLVGLTALLLASKYEDFWHPRVVDLIGISAESYTRDQMLGMEKAILKKLKFRLNAPTPYVFMLRFIKAAQSDRKFEHLAFYLIELCLVEYETLKFKPSLLCASAIYVARCTLQMIPTWTPLLGKHARYGESQIRECAEMILKFHKAAKTAILKVTYDKYMRHDYGRVAALKPLDRLPG